MAKQKKGEEQKEGELNPVSKERNRLKNLAYTTKILSQTPAKGFTPLNPSKTLIKHHGKDILRKSQRKNRYLFTFPGLLAPLSGGKIGELTALGSKNPLLYLDFPQGRMKLFGTIVYPKNRYLTLQFSKGGKNVMCEDCFDTMIVFSDAWWVGRKEDNPDESRLDFPKELFEGISEVDFRGGAGAGASAMGNKDVKKVIAKTTDGESPSESPLDDMESEPSDGEQNTTDMINITPVRHSERTAGKNFRFAEVPSEDDSVESASDMSGEETKEATKSSNQCLLDQDHGAPKTMMAIEISEDIQLSTRANTEQASLSTMQNSETKESSRGPLVQATISTLFKKVEEKLRNYTHAFKMPMNDRSSFRHCKKSAGGSKKMAASKESTKLQQSSSKTSKKTKAAELGKTKSMCKEKQSEKRNDRKKQKAEANEVEDEIEEFTSASEETEGSDEDWLG